MLNLHEIALIVGVCRCGLLFFSAFAEGCCICCLETKREKRAPGKQSACARFNGLNQINPFEVSSQRIRCFR
jgi:hypothetical protein